MDFDDIDTFDLEGEVEAQIQEAVYRAMDELGISREVYADLLLNNKYEEKASFTLIISLGPEL